MALFNITTSTPQAVAPAPAQSVEDTTDYEAVTRLSRALTGEPFDVPGMTPGSLYPHQWAGVQAALSSIERWGGTLVGDDMGMGKTREALALVALMLARKGGRALVVAPVANWAGYLREIRAAFPGIVPFRAHGHTPEPVPAQANLVWMSDDPKTMAAWLTVVTKDEAKKTTYAPSALAQSITVFVRDEAHRDKGNSGKPGVRGHVSMTVAQDVHARDGAVICMTGTLLVNRPIEALIPLRCVGGDRLIKAVAGEHPSKPAKTLWAYQQSYCGAMQTRFGVDVTGASNTKRLHDNLRATCYVRREKSDLDATALPNFGWAVQPLSLNGNMTAYKRIERDFIGWIAEQHGPDAAWRASRAEAIQQMMRLWEAAGVAKAVAATAHVADLVAEGRQVVVFYQHQSVHDAMLTNLLRERIAVGSINGSTRDRGAVEESFQRGETQVVLAQLQAAGQALTLTAASEAVWVQLPWSAGMLAQQRDRIRRVDDISRQRAARGEAVTFHVLQAAHEDGADTIDMKMWAVLGAKAEVIDGVNAGKDVTITDESVVQQVMRSWFA